MGNSAHGSPPAPAAFDLQIGSRSLPLREELRGLRGPLILHRMVKRELVVKSPAEDSEGQQHCERQCWIRAPSFAVDGQQDGAPTISDSASMKNCKAVQMYFVGFVLRPVIRLESPESSLFTILMRGKLCSRLSGSPGVTPNGQGSEAAPIKEGPRMSQGRYHRSQEPFGKVRMHHAPWQLAEPA